MDTNMRLGVGTVATTGQGANVTTNENSPLLEVKGLKTHFFLDEGTVRAVDGVDFTLRRGSTLGVVGESGCGKSVTALSILQLVDSPGRIVEGQVLYYGSSSQGENGEAERSEVVDLLAYGSDSQDIRAIRGREISMIFQEPMVSLSPVHTIGDQISENVLLHFDVTKREAMARAAEMLGRVGLPHPEDRLGAYPFELSGGMRQRAMIAMALVCGPSLLIADEPTTALDVTTQAQILELLSTLQRDMGMAVMIITHNLGVVAEVCDEVVVMYLGEVVEQAPVDAIFHSPLHPYTQALLRSIPVLGTSKGKKLDPIEGAVPNPYNRPNGCPFHPRCPRLISGVCNRERPRLVRVADGRSVRCVLYEEDALDAHTS